LIPVFTFVTDPESYSQMRRSFEGAGFGAGHARFVELHGDGPQGVPEPYSKITELIAAVTEPFFILCHQDVRLDQGHGLDELLAAIHALDSADDRWAVAGNAGGSRSLRVIRSIRDPHGGGSDDALPAIVHSLDENFLVVRTGTGIGCSPGLSGFHLYGTDLCLNALEHDRRSYVIDFRLRHLSPGKRDAAYEAARDRFVAHWNERFLARYVRTTVELLFLSRWTPLRAALGSTRARSFVKSRGPLRAAAGAVLAPRS
jgi:hypothetical protein